MWICGSPCPNRIAFFFILLLQWWLGLCTCFPALALEKVSFKILSKSIEQYVCSEKALQTSINKSLMVKFCHIFMMMLKRQLIYHLCKSACSTSWYVKKDIPKLWDSWWVSPGPKPRKSSWKKPYLNQDVTLSKNQKRKISMKHWNCYWTISEN